MLSVVYAECYLTWESYKGLYAECFMQNVVLLNVVAPTLPQVIPEILDKDVSEDSDKHSSLLRHGIWEFYSVGLTWGRYYKTFYSHNLQIFVIS